MIAHLHGDPTPWPSVEAQQAAEQEFRDRASAVAAGGVAHVEDIRCETLPCIAVITSTIGPADLRVELYTHFPDAGGYGEWEESGGRFTTFVEPRLEDVAPGDPHLLMRRTDLLRERRARELSR